MTQSISSKNAMELRYGYRFRLELAIPDGKLIGNGNLDLNICMGSVLYSGMSAEAAYTFAISGNENSECRMKILLDT